MTRRAAVSLRPAYWLAAVFSGCAILIIGILFMSASIAGTEGKPVEIISSGQDVSVPEDATVIEINKFTYSPASTTVTENATVVWANQESFDHDVTFKSSDLLAEELISPKIGKGGMILARFNEPGEYRYYCHLHPFMEGTVKVEPE